MKQYRNEWKFEYKENDVPELISRLSLVLVQDQHGENGKYSVYSMYFDGYNDTSARDTEAGLSIRYKYRIRHYGDISSLHLEKKEKNNGLCHKETCSLSIEEYEAIMTNNTNFLLWNCNKKLLNEFAYEMIARQLKPKSIIFYNRTAFIYPPLNIRITIDSNISTSYDYDNFLSNNFFKYPLQEKKNNILEVKFDRYLPSYIKKIIENNHIIRQSFSKYRQGRLLMRKVGI